MKIALYIRVSSEPAFFKTNHNRTYQTKRKDDSNERYS